MTDALLWNELDGGIAACALCAHGCRIAVGKRGICGVRENSGGRLYTHTYGRAAAEHIDPIEKKPLYHFLPSSETFSVAAIGCNFKCDFCQNWSISQALGYRRDDIDKYGATLTPGQIVEHAVNSKCRSVSFTYTEPTVFFEYAHDAAKLARGAGLGTVFVSNGYMTRDVLQMMKPYLDACNIDLKSFRDDFYKERCGASLAPVLDTLRILREMDIWLEVTTLVIAGENDTDEELRDVAEFIVKELGADVPWHVSRFFPQHRMLGHPPTPVSSVERAVNIGREAGLLYVYAGNADTAQDTICPKCGAIVIRRRGYRSEAGGLAGGSCKSCGTNISGIF